MPESVTPAAVLGLKGVHARNAVRNLSLSDLDDLLAAETRQLVITAAQARRRRLLKEAEPEARRPAVYEPAQRHEPDLRGANTAHLTPLGAQVQTEQREEAAALAAGTPPRRSCTRCGHEGPTADDFGYRTANVRRKDGTIHQRTYTQPQCRECRRAAAKRSQARDKA